MKVVYGKRWEQVRAGIEADIVAERLQAGHKLPNDHDLGERFGVNRHTVRHAIKSMEQDGLLRVEQGRGTFVVGDATAYLLSPTTRLTENLLSQGRLARRDILDTVVTKADERLARHLDLQLGDEILRIDTLSYQDDIPIVAARNYFPAERAPGLLDAFSGTNSITAALSAVGLTDYRRKWIKINSRLPTEKEASTLKMSTTAPVFVQENLDCIDNVPIKFGENVMCASRITLEVDFDKLKP